MKPKTIRRLFIAVAFAVGTLLVGALALKFLVVPFLIGLAEGFYG